MLQGLVERAVYKKFGSIEFQYRLLQKSEDEISSPEHKKRTTETTLGSRDSTTAVVTIIKREAERDVGAESKRKDRPCKFV